MAGTTGASKVLAYKHAQFSTRLPVDYVYSPTHWWAQALDGDGGVWRIGITKFSTRMLGEMVDHGFEVQPGAALEFGQIIGWLEGFKAISDVYCIALGEFAGVNPALAKQVTLINKDPYCDGWIYEVRGELDERCVDVQAYADHLDKTIDRILAQQKGDEIQ